ncbi:ferredoxin [Yoonia maritima]|uniref:ferredoxin n=1 Tax=Yoonia maritima TaxID=1435347 RepID=UPI000D114C8F
MKRARLIESLAQQHLQLMGRFAISTKDALPLSRGTVLLIGPDEPSFWAHFTASVEYLDGRPDPMDRWSKRVLDPLATMVEGHALYPFGGPPYHPFYTWAIRSGQAWASPIGFLVHDQVGLFVSYRGALVVPWENPTPETQSPCKACAEKPCSTACPVGALTTSGYDVPSCKNFLTTPAGQASCMTQGCAARRACPIGQNRRIADQSAFHMDAFL